VGREKASRWGCEEDILDVDVGWDDSGLYSGEDEKVRVS
jgi:hypothetical protein